MRKFLIYIGLFILILSLASCKKDADKVDPDISDTTDGYSHEQASDYIWEEASVFDIILNGSSIQSSSAEVIVTGTVAKIQKEGNYRITGMLNNGQIVIDADTSSLIRIILDNVNLTNTSGPAILVHKSKKTIIFLPPGTNNSLIDGSSYADPASDPNATLFSKSDLTIFGEGTLNITANYKDGISSKDGLIVKSGNLNITSKDDALCGKDYLIVRDGVLHINSQGDGMRSDDASNHAVGYILIDAGSFSIISGSDGITAINYVNMKGGNFNIVTGGGSSTVPGDQSSKGIKGLVKINMAANSCIINSSDVGLHSNNSIEIISGLYTISSAKKGIRADQSVSINDGTVTITKADEGIESKIITVNKGTVVVYSNDDSFNATAGQATESDDLSCIYINGGTVILSTSDGDAIDSNGSIVLKDGQLIIHGPALAPEVAIDYNGIFQIDGGLLIASGTNSNMTLPPSEISIQNSLKVTFNNSHSAGTLFHIRDSENNELITFKPERNYQSMIYSSPLLITGKTYQIFESGTHTGDQQHGLFENGSYSPGTLLSTFSVTSKLTTLNNI